MRQSGTIEMHGEDEKTFEVQDPKLCKEDPATASLNPWSLRCHREQLAKMRSGKSNGVHSILFSPAIVGTHLRITLTEANLIFKSDMSKQNTKLSNTMYFRKLITS